MLVFTVGHSNKTIHSFLDLLKAHDIGLIADIRRFPESRKYPHFSGELLRESLHDKGIAYRHYEPLGGRRSKATENSQNTAWSVPSFQYYADYMQTPVFRKAAERFLKDAQGKRCALMCAEAVYFRCHRRLVADYLIASGHEIFNIESRTKAPPHKLTDFAVVQNGNLSYPALPDLFSPEQRAG